MMTKKTLRYASLPGSIVFCVALLVASLSYCPHCFYRKYKGYLFISCGVASSLGYDNHNWNSRNCVVLILNFFLQSLRDNDARRCLSFLNVFIGIIGAILLFVAIYANSVEEIANNLTFVITICMIIGCALAACAVLGCVGICGPQNGNFGPLVLLLYYGGLVFMTTVISLLVGFCFLNAQSGQASLERNWPLILSSLPPAQRDALSLEKISGIMKYSFYAIGILAIIIVLMITVGMNHVKRLVTPLRAYRLFIAATNLSLLPFALALIAVAAYHADTAPGLDVAYLSFTCFAVAMFVLFVMAQGACGVCLRSRGLLLGLMLFNTIPTILFLGAGAASGFAASFVKDKLHDNWLSFRKILPITFSGKYNIEHFDTFVHENLKIFSYLCFIAFGVFLSLTVGAKKLRLEMKTEAKLAKDAIKAVRAKVITRQEAKVFAEYLDEASGSKVKRSLARFCFQNRCISILFFIVLLLAVVATIGAALGVIYYINNCQEFGTFNAELTYPTSALPPVPTLTGVPSNSSVSYFLQTDYTRGNIDVTVGALVTNYPPFSGTVPPPLLYMSKVASSESATHPNFPVIISRFREDTGIDVLGDNRGKQVATLGRVPEMGIVANEKEPQLLFNLDRSCQHAKMVLMVPPVPAMAAGPVYEATAHPLALRFLVDSYYAGVNIKWDQVAAADRPPVRRLDATTTWGPITLSHVRFGYKGFALKTQHGHISLVSSTAVCDPLDVAGQPGLGGAYFQSPYGFVTVADSSFKDCDIHMTGQSSLLQLHNITATSQLGGTVIRMQSDRGLMSIRDSSVESAVIEGSIGSIYFQNNLVASTVRITNRDGEVFAEGINFALGGGMQIETTTGGVRVHARKFAGILSIITSGTITCTGNGFDNADPCDNPTVETGSDGTNVNVIEDAPVNCLAANDCLYLGSIAITSAFGNIEIVMDSWNRM